MTERTKSPPPDRSPKAPAMPVPPGACDCHFHFVGPQDRFPIRASSPVEFEDCTMDDYLELQGALGLSRGVLVHGFMQPPSYEYMLHALLREPDRLRGVAYPSINITDQEIEILSRAGVVGQRYNFRNTPQLPMKHVERLIEAGWHAQFLYRGSEECEAWADEIRKTPGTIVIDHMGFPEPQGGLESPAYKFLMEMMESGRCWAKLSQRFSTEKTMPFADAAPLVRNVVERFPDRCLWGSDWPHPGYLDPNPNDGDLLGLLADWAPELSLQKKILVDNPIELFGFPPA